MRPRRRPYEVVCATVNGMPVKVVSVSDKGVVELEHPAPCGAEVRITVRRCPHPTLPPPEARVSGIKLVCPDCGAVV